MTVTYTIPWPDLNVKVPKLHRVKYAETEGDVLAAYQYSYKDHLVDKWLKKNCRHPYYHAGCLTEKFIDFEDDQEAVLFALRWS